jgi:hypothetical protein
MIKLRPNLSLLDWFTPYNFDNLNTSDCDVGSSGPMLLPGTNFILGGGKEGKFFLLDKNHMGHFVSNTNNNSQIAQWFYVILPDDLNRPYTMAAGHTHHIHGGPVYWNGPNGPWIYIWPENDCLRAFHFNNGRFPTTTVPPKSAPPVTKTQDAPGTGGHPIAFPGGFLCTPASIATEIPKSEQFGMPGGALSISANDSTAGTGILWASHPFKLDPVRESDIDANQHVVRGILRAYNASDLTKELWNSEMNHNQDSIGNFAMFNPPTIANGKVYLASFGRDPDPADPKSTAFGRDPKSYHFAVYGLVS